ncbi:hypothetical protein IM660_12700 [Ruania alkalisoli]|uniref:HTH luxR-type domain-containing protein n=1 Tax=Ruania alkalisoli TaxID=2779775 RepID=A0A7M1SPP8_9MICO|nr:hypothetical protein [Ruania alkalisoli]QOR69536.1 hypothetical protein IM660_12700 [Ruania alkalisoli]
MGGHMALSEELTRLLAAALSIRAPDAAHLAEVTGQKLEDVSACLDALRRRGFLDLADGSVTYRRPEVPVSQEVGQDLQSMIRTLQQTTAGLNTTLGTLPQLMQAWEVGGADERTIAADVARGPDAAAEAWLLHFTRDTPTWCDLCLPDVARVLAQRPTERPVADWTSIAMADLRIRLVVSRADTNDKRIRPALERMLEQGAEVRSHPDPPSMFWVSDHAVAGLPATWGEPWPSRVVTVRSAPVAESVAALFATTWHAATPLSREQRSWDPMLALMNQGMTMEAAAARLGMAQRTARRRVADAMAYFGVSSHFALGAAWGRARAEDDRE